jgi:Tryptophan-rich Synechocystis species C-terminal domain
MTGPATNPVIIVGTPPVNGGGSTGGGAVDALGNELSQLMAAASDGFQANGPRVIALQAGELSKASQAQVGRVLDGVTVTQATVDANQALLNQFGVWCRANNVSIMVYAPLYNAPSGDWTYQWLAPAVTAGLPVSYVSGVDEPELFVTQSTLSQVAGYTAAIVAQIAAAYPTMQLGEWASEDVTGAPAFWTAYNALAQTDVIPTFSYIEADSYGNTPWFSPPATSNGSYQTLASEVQAAGMTLFAAIRGTTENLSGAGWTAQAEQRIAVLAQLSGVTLGALDINSWEAGEPSTATPANADGSQASAATMIQAIFPLYQAGRISSQSGSLISGSSQLLVSVGTATGVGGLSMSFSATDIGAQNRAAVVITDQTGLLTATASGSGTVTGNGTTTMVLDGDAADINAELESLTVAEPVAGPDLVDVESFDSAGRTGDAQVFVVAGSSRNQTTSFIPAVVNGVLMQGWTSASVTTAAVGMVSEVLTWNTTTLNTSGVAQTVKLDSAHLPSAEVPISFALGSNPLSTPTSNWNGAPFTPTGLTSQLTVATTTLTFSQRTGVLLEIDDSFLPLASLTGGTLPGWLTSGGDQITYMNTGDNLDWQASWGPQFATATLTYGNYNGSRVLLELVLQGNESNSFITDDEVFDPTTGGLWELFTTSQPPTNANDPLSTFPSALMTVTEYNTGDNPNWDSADWGTNAQVTENFQDYYTTSTNANQALNLLSITGTSSVLNTSDAVPIAPFAKVTIFDPTASVNGDVTVTVTMSSTEDGTWTILGGGTYNARTGVWTITGSASSVTNGLDNLLFSPTQRHVALGQSFSTGFIVTVTEDGGSTASAAATAVVTTAVAIESDGTTTLGQIGDHYTLMDDKGLGPTIKFQNAIVTVGQFGAAVTPIAAARTASGYEVAWYNAAAQQYTVWNTDADGNYVSSATDVVGGQDPTLLALEPSFHDDLNGSSGGITKHTVIETDQLSTNLWLVANEYVLDWADGKDPTLKYQGRAVTVGQFGANVAPIAAAWTATGFEVAWYNASAQQYVVWNTDADGNYVSSETGVVGANDPTLLALEPGFRYDLNGSGGITSGTLIETNRTDASLYQVANEYMLIGTDYTVPTLKLQGSPVTVGQFGATVTPIAVTLTATGFEVAWYNASAQQYVVWNTDADGNYVSSETDAVGANDPTLLALEPSFQHDLNGSGAITADTVIEANGINASLWQVANEYVLVPYGNPGPTLKLQGSAVTVGQFGAAVAPIAVAQTGTGYEIAWYNASAQQYVVWNTDRDGNYVGSATGVVGANDPTLLVLEPGFHYDLNGSGAITAHTVIETDGFTGLWQVANEYVLAGTSNSDPTLKLQGSPVTVGQFGANVAPIAAAQTVGGYEVAWGVAGSDQYTVWTTDDDGNYTGTATNLVPGQSIPQADHVSTQVITAGPTVNLIGQSQAVTINLGTNTASASSGLSAPSLSFIGTPDSISLGTGAATIEYALQASSGIEAVSGFILGTDLLNIDLLGAATSTLVAHDTTVNGNAAIALASSGDASHGLVLTNLGGGLTAAQLLASHTTFVGGHALIS